MKNGFLFLCPLKLLQNLASSFCFTSESLHNKRSLSIIYNTRAFEIRVYLQLGDTWINVTKRFNKCDEYCSHFWLHDSFEGRELSIESSLFPFR